MHAEGWPSSNLCLSDDRENNVLTHYLIVTPFDAFVNRAGQDQTALVRAVLSGSTLISYESMIYLILHLRTCNEDLMTFMVFFVLCTDLKVYLFIIIHSGWTLA